MPVLLPREVTQYLSATKDGEAGADSIDDLYIDLDDTDRGDYEESVKEDARDANDALNERQQDGSIVLNEEEPFLSDSNSGVQQGTDPTISKREYKTDGARWRRYQKWLKKSMKASSGPWAKPIRRPGEDKTKESAFGQGSEFATLANCINELPLVLSTCQIDGKKGTEHGELLVEYIAKLANVTSRYDRDLEYRHVINTLREITESDCNLHPECRKVQWQWDHYFRNSKNELPDLSVGWESLAVDRTLPDNRGTKEEMNQALKDGEKLGNAADSLRGLNCTIGDQPASTFVQLTQEQLAELDGNPGNLTALDHLNTTINAANDASCHEWKDQKTFVEESRKAYNDISSAEPSENMEGRYTIASAVNQMEWREQSLVPSTFAPGSLAIAAAAATAGLSYGLSLVT